MADQLQTILAKTVEATAPYGLERSCRLWAGYRNRKGYGQLPFRVAEINGRQAHRAVYALSVGQIPEGLDVCHHCDRPACLEETHFFLGTAADNLRDMRSKGRDRGACADNREKAHCPAGHEYSHRESRRGPERRCVPCDDRLALARYEAARAVADRPRRDKLNFSQASEIRALRVTGARVRDLQDRFGVSKATVERVLAGTSWSRIPRCRAA